jgi:hypothetical protein
VKKLKEEEEEEEEEECWLWPIFVGREMTIFAKRRFLRKDDFCKKLPIYTKLCRIDPCP